MRITALFSIMSLKKEKRQVLRAALLVGEDEAP